jgi:hypothetical protein
LGLVPRGFSRYDLNVGIGNPILVANRFKADHTLHDVFDDVFGNGNFVRCSFWMLSVIERNGRSFSPDGWHRPSRRKL